MSKPIILSEVRWERLRMRLLVDYPLSYVTIRWKMKEKLGFTVRQHLGYVQVNGVPKYKEMVHLDFYNSSAQTMFLLKYSEYLEKSGNTTLDIQ